MRRTVDGFQMQSFISFLPDKVEGINAWSYGKTTKIEITTVPLNFKSVSWRGKTAIVEYEMFTGMIRQWMQGDRVNKGIDKAKALDLAFGML